MDDPHPQAQMTRPVPLAMLALLAACATHPRGPSAPRAYGPVTARASAADTLIRPAVPRYPYTLLDSATADVDGDGVAERVDLTATVELDSGGVPLWDDGHAWMVAVRDGADTYPLMERHVPWGGAAFWIVAPDSAGPATILVQTSMSAGGSGGTRLEAFVFDRTRGGYVRTGDVGAFGHPAAYRGPPDIGTLAPTVRARPDTALTLPSDHR